MTGIALLYFWLVIIVSVGVLVYKVILPLAISLGILERTENGLQVVVFDRIAEKHAAKTESSVNAKTAQNTPTYIGSGMPVLGSAMRSSGPVPSQKSTGRATEEALEEEPEELEREPLPTINNRNIAPLPPISAGVTTEKMQFTPEELALILSRHDTTTIEDALALVRWRQGEPEDYRPWRWSDSRVAGIRLGNAAANVAAVRELRTSVNPPPPVKPLTVGDKLEIRT